MVSQQQEAHFQPHHAVMLLAQELRLFLLPESWEQCTSLVFAFSLSSQRDFDGTTAHHYSFMNSLAASKKWCLLVGFDCFSVQVSLGQCSAAAAADFQQWYLPSAAFQLLLVTGCPSAISGKDRFKDTKLEEERVCLLCVSLNPPIHTTS